LLIQSELIEKDGIRDETNLVSYYFKRMEYNSSDLGLITCSKMIRDAKNELSIIIPEGIEHNMNITTHAIKVQCKVLSDSIQKVESMLQTCCNDGQRDRNTLDEFIVDTRTILAEIRNKIAILTNTVENITQRTTDSENTLKLLKDEYDQEVLRKSVRIDPSNFGFKLLALEVAPNQWRIYKLGPTGWNSGGLLPPSWKRWTVTLEEGNVNGYVMVGLALPSGFLKNGVNHRIPNVWYFYLSTGGTYMQGSQNDVTRNIPPCRVNGTSVEFVYDPQPSNTSTLSVIVSGTTYRLWSNLPDCLVPAFEIHDYNTAVTFQKK
jgi:hypothetical protein